MAPPRVQPKRPQRSAAEQAVWDRFLGNGVYQAMGCCANPTCGTPHDVQVTAGTAPTARICVTCFEFDFDCSFPRKGSLDAMRERLA